jgi:hypothetical protein
MNMHELLGIDSPEGPCCLFCHSQCSMSGGGVNSSPKPLCSDQYSCLDCSESFTVHRIGDDLPYAFDFTCGQFLVVHYYHTKFLMLRRWDMMTTETSEDNPVGIRYFEIDFSDKQALISKLKIYMLFA